MIPPCYLGFCSYAATLGYAPPILLSLATLVSLALSGIPGGGAPVFWLRSQMIPILCYLGFSCSIFHSWGWGPSLFGSDRNDPTPLLPWPSCAFPGLVPCLGSGGDPGKGQGNRDNALPLLWSFGVR